MITKKSFIEMCNFHVYTGWNGSRTKHNVIYFDYLSNDNCRGFKFAVAMDIKQGNKQELINQLYNWVTGKVQEPDYYVRYKYAETDDKRFKVGLSLNW
jgi:hypothetical protein